MWNIQKRNNKKIILNYKIIWYRLIPYVIAEMKNSEWKDLQKFSKEKKLKFEILNKIYNSNGNWYILEGLDYFWFRWNIFTNKENNILFSDSMWLRYNEKSDKEKYQMLKREAEESIDDIWNRVNKILNKRII